MKKSMISMLLGVGVGAAGSLFMYSEIKNGNMKKIVDKAAKTCEDVVRDM